MMTDSDIIQLQKDYNNLKNHYTKSLKEFQNLAISYKNDLAEQKLQTLETNNIQEKLEKQIIGIEKRSVEEKAEIHKEFSRKIFVLKRAFQSKEKAYNELQIQFLSLKNTEKRFPLVTNQSNFYLDYTYKKPQVELVHPELNQLQEKLSKISNENNNLRSIISKQQIEFHLIDEIKEENIKLKRKLEELLSQNSLLSERLKDSVKNSKSQNLTENNSEVPEIETKRLESELCLMKQKLSYLKSIISNKFGEENAKEVFSFEI